MGRKVVILLGHPGAGKGTQARAIMYRLDIPQISTGDMLREAIARKTANGKEAKAKMDAGELVSDALVNGIVAERISHDDCKKGFILDGYPRTVPQAETFCKELSNDDDLFVIEIGAQSDGLTNRLTGRWICPGCGEIYNTFSRAPKHEGVCDVCGWTLFHRSDDREDLVRERFRTYNEETFPLVDYYQRQGAYYRVDGMRPIEEVTREILMIIDKKKVLMPSVRGGNE
ncbi:MAG TPA: adenylate kinase [Terriglobia bacterium]|nr:adenylate kinase [Terriglobia bacterium]